MKHAKPLRLTALALALAAASFSAHALFGDDDARRAILDLRQRLDTAITAQNKLVSYLLSYLFFHFFKDICAFDDFFLSFLKFLNNGILFFLARLPAAFKRSGYSV